jgi:hypothetical protein
VQDLAACPGLVPLSAALTAAAMIPGIALLAVYLASRLELGRRVALGIFLALLILSTHVAGLLTGSFFDGLKFGALVTGALGYCVARPACRALVRPPPDFFSLLLALAVSSSLLLLLMFFDIHDKLYSITSHFAFAHEILNGAYPPAAIFDTSRPLAYHFAVDLLAAILMATLHADASLAFDVIAFLATVATVLIFSDLVRRLFGRGETMAMLIAAWGGGLPWIALLSPRTELFGSPIWAVFSLNVWINPSFTSYQFQPPWSIGLPIALASLSTLTTFEYNHDRRVFRIAMVIALLGALSLSEFVLFICASGIILLHLAWTATVGRSRTALFGGVAILIALPCFAVLGGFFNILLAHRPAAGLLLLTPGVANGALDSTIWMVASLGLLPVAAVAGLRSMRRSWQIPLAATAAVALILPNVVRYPTTWDMAKFVTAAEVILAIFAAGGLSGLLRGAVRVALAASLIVSGVIFAAAPLLVGGDSVPFFAPALWRFASFFELDRDDAAAMCWLRKETRGHELVLRAPPAAIGYAVLGGLPQGFIDDNTAKAFNLPSSLVQQRLRLVALPTPPVDAYRAAGIRWLVADLDPARADPLAEFVRQHEADGVLLPVFGAGTKRVYRISPGNQPVLR